MKHTTKSGARFSLFDKHVIMDNVDPNLPYLTRWRIVETPLFGVLLHKIHLPDADRSLHDHPWNFLSVILRGGYTEEYRPSLGSIVRERTWRPGSIHMMRRGEFHRIKTLFEPCWTLMLVGRNHVDWGFERAGTRVHAKSYFKYNWAV